MWRWKAWEVSDRGSLELKIYDPCWLEGLSVTEIKVNLITDYIQLYHRHKWLT